MNIKNKFKSILILILLAEAVIAGSYFLLLSSSNLDIAKNTAYNEPLGWKFPITSFSPINSMFSSIFLAYSSVRSPGGVPSGLPVRLKIPIIGVDSLIEDALITPDGRMDVPQGSVNVAWFALGPHPGQIGSAVIGGHFGIENGVPFVFYNLDKLKVGDKVYILDDKNNTLAFQVRSIKLFNRNADATSVFTSSDGLAHLNLITCEGIWNQVDGTYPERRVVFTDSIPGEGPVVVKTPVVSSIKTTPVSSKPVAVNTNSAKTKTSPVLKPSQVAVSPTLPSTAIMIPESSPVSTSQNPIQFIKNLYSTKTDGLIISVFLILIIFVTVKIISLI
jgi:LPXTG-site transpeptidase (sortase) family protein